MTLAYDAITNLGLTSGLLGCYDPGDTACYSGSGQSYSSHGGTLSAFYLGATSASQSSDPTFNGSGGSERAYWSFDGGDYFTYSTTIPTAISNFAHDNAAFTIAFFGRVGSTGSPQNFFGTWNGSTAAGTQVLVSGSNSLAVIIRPGSPTEVLNVGMSTASVSAGTWYFMAVSVNEATGTGTFVLDATVESFTSTYTSPLSSAVPNFKFGTRGDTGGILTNGSQLGAMMIWSTALTSTDLLNLRSALLGRWGPYTINPSAAVFTINSSLNFLVSLICSLTAQTWTITGEAVDLFRQWLVSLGVTSYLVTPLNALLQKALGLSGSVAAYLISVVDIGATKTLNAYLSSVGYTISSSLDFLRSRLLSLVSAEYLLTASDVLMQRAKYLFTTAADYTLTAIDISITKSLDLAVQAQSYLITGTATLTAYISGLARGSILWIRRRRR